MSSYVTFFFFNDTATTEIYTLSLHDALPIFGNGGTDVGPPQIHPEQVRGLTIHLHGGCRLPPASPALPTGSQVDRKSTRLNSSHANISYAVFCLKKKKTLKSETYNCMNTITL